MKYLGIPEIMITLYNIFKIRHILNNLYWELALSCLHKYQFFPPEKPNICFRRKFLDEISVSCCQDRDYCNRWLYPKLVEVKPTGLYIIYVCPL